MRNLFLFISFCLFTNFIFSQTVITYHIEESIEELEQQHKEAWGRVKEIDGYRIQLFASAGVNSRNTVQQMYDEFVVKNPKIPAYISYFEPYFRLRVGNFDTKLQAYKTLLMLRTTYNGAFIIKDQIEFK